MGSTWGSYLGLVFLGATFISIGLFSSSITNNQIIAFIIAALLCFICYFGFAFIYSFDTSTGVCPSLHVAYSMGILSVGLKDPLMTKFGKAVLTFVVLMICLAVCFVKQHSAIDVFAALPVCVLAELLVFGKDYWLPKLTGKQE